MHHRAWNAQHMQPTSTGSGELQWMEMEEKNITLLIKRDLAYIFREYSYMFVNRLKKKVER